MSASCTSITYNNAVVNKWRTSGCLGDNHQSFLVDWNGVFMWHFNRISGLAVLGGLMYGLKKLIMIK